jgi:hypothetical protein
MFSRLKIDHSTRSSIEMQTEFIELAFTDNDHKDFDVQVIKLLHAGDWVGLNELLS